MHVRFVWLKTSRCLEIRADAYLFGSYFEKMKKKILKFTYTNRASHIPFEINGFRQNSLHTPNWSRRERKNLPPFPSTSTWIQLQTSEHSLHWSVISIKYACVLPKPKVAKEFWVRLSYPMDVHARTHTHMIFWKALRLHLFFTFHTFSILFSTI